MTTEFNLSDRVWGGYETPESVIFVSDVKEFIKRLKEEIPNFVEEDWGMKLIKRIDKLVGDKLK